MRDLMKLVKKCFNSSYQLVFKNLIKCLKEAFRKLFVVEALKPLLRSSSDASHILLYRKKQAEYIDHDMSICNQSRLNQFMTFNKHDAIFWWKISSHSPMLPLIPKNEIFLLNFAHQSISTNVSEQWAEYRFMAKLLVEKFLLNEDEDGFRL